MSQIHVVQLGECLSSITKRFGFRSYRTIYNDAVNATFKHRRPNPNELLPGDQLIIPDRETKSEEAATGVRHRFFTRGDQTFLRLRIRYRVPVDYELTASGETATGTTDGRELISVKIAADATRATLLLWLAGTPHVPEDAVGYTLHLGRLAPIDTVPGVQGRLQNLGFYDGPIDGSMTPATITAIEAFERSLGAPVSGANTPALRALLAREHDG